MYQVIPENFSQLLVKRLFMLFCLALLAVIALNLYHANSPTSGASFSTDGNRLEIIKTDIAFSSMNLQ